jgi:tRNA/tmRNA/rRNA uracil-C5-methylase (TrmA/RlmC/RlmD family)
VSESLVGDVLDLRVGAPAHGGHCVARIGDEPHGRVVFVRHALPGERVRARVTEDAGGAFCRADAIEVLEPSPDRVTPPCPHAGAGRCGGCDWQHASDSAQRALKAAVVREQLLRLAGLDVAVEVEPLPGGLLGWRTRTVYSIDGDGRVGLRRHRSHAVERLSACPLGAAGVGDAPALQRLWPGLTGVELARGDDGAVTVLAHRPGPGRQARGRRPPDRVEVRDGPDRLRHTVGGRTFELEAAGFWQAHPQAAATFSGALLDQLRPQPGETALDLYAGAGLFTALLGEAVGSHGRVVGVESSRSAVADAAGNLADLPHAEVRYGRVTGDLVGDLDVAPDVVVLDPPRAGAGPDVMAAILAHRPRAIGYVACDPAALGRDVRVAVDVNWRLAGLRAFDAFPMTHHVECVALLVPGTETQRTPAMSATATPDQ